MPTRNVNRYPDYDNGRDAWNNHQNNRDKDKRITTLQIDPGDAGYGVGGTWRVGVIGPADPATGALPRDVIDVDVVNLFDAVSARDSLGIEYLFSESAPPVFRSETFTGTNTDPWGDMGWTEDAASTTAAFSEIQGNKGRQDTGTAGGSGTDIEIMELDQGHPDDFEMTGSWTGVTAQTYMKVRFRATAQNAAYELYISMDDAECRIHEVNPSTTTLDGPATITAMGANDTAHFRLRVVGSLLRAKVWVNAEDEPSDWTLEATDTTLTGNKLYFASSNFSTQLNHLSDYDDFAIYPIPTGYDVIVITAETVDSDLSAWGPMALLNTPIIHARPASWQTSGVGGAAPASVDLATIDAQTASEFEVPGAPGVVTFGDGGIVTTSTLDAADLPSNVVNIAESPTNSDIVIGAIASGETFPDSNVSLVKHVVWGADLGDPEATALLVLDLPGAAGDYAHTPDSAAVSVTGDIQFDCHLTMDDWTPSAVQFLCAKWVDAGDNRSFNFRIETGGALTFANTTDGLFATNHAHTSTAAPAVSNGEDLHLRFTVDVDAGSTDHDVTFYTSSDGVSYVQLGAVVNTAGVTSIFDGTAFVQFGSLSGGASVAGTMHSAQLYDGITLVADFDPHRDADPGDTTFVSRYTGETWTIAGSAAIIGGAVWQTIIDAIKWVRT